MTENMKKFLEEVSKDEELARKVSSENDKAAFIAIAKDMGITLTESDFEEDKEISDDELDAVAGGGQCVCVVGGGGKKDDNDKKCVCVVGGIGEDAAGEQRCLCPVAGNGLDTKNWSEC